MTDNSVVASSPSLSVQTAKSTKQRHVIRMWNGGPLRQFSGTKLSGHYVAYSSPILTGYAGSYVCDECQRPCAGVYFVRPVGVWLCGTCRKERQS